jgi:hypothetical protein
MWWWVQAKDGLGMQISKFAFSMGKVAVTHQLDHSHHQHPRFQH